MNVGTATGHFGVTTRITRVGFADGWTGAVAIGVIVYVVAAIWVTMASLPPSAALDFYRLVSDQPAAIAATLLAIVAARVDAPAGGPQDLASSSPPRSSPTTWATWSTRSSGSPT